MTRKQLWVIFALMLLFFGLGISSDILLHFLVPTFGEQQLQVVRPGVILLKAIFVADSLLILCIAHYSTKTTQRVTAYIPMWAGNSSTSPLWLTQSYSSIVFGLILTSVALRLVGLNTDLWIDEVRTLVNAVRPEFGEILSIYGSDNQHTLYSLLAKVSVQLFGEHAWSLRLPALLFGIASIWATARIGRLAFGVREALLAALICAVSYHHIWFSQNARGYTILLFVALLSTDCLLRGLKTGQWRYWSCYAALIALGAYAHLTGVFLAVAHAMTIAVLLIKEGRLSDGRWKPVAGILLSAWLTIHLYALTIPQLFEFFAPSTSAPATISAATTTIIGSKNILWLVTEAFQQFGIDVSVWWPALIGLLAPCGWIGYLFVRRDWIFSFAAFLPAVLTILVLLTLDRNLWPRMVFGQLGFVVLFVVAALVAAGDYVAGRSAKIKPAGLFGLTILPSIILCMASITMLPNLYKYPKQDYQAARDYVQRFVSPTDKVLGLHVAGRIYALYYETEWLAVNTVDEILDQRSLGGHTWVLYTRPIFLKQARPELTEFLDNNFEVLRVFPGSLHDGEIIVARSRSQNLEKP